MSRRNVFAVVMAAAFLIPFPAQIRAADVPAPLLACTAEPDDAQRLACFDRAVAQLRKSAEPAAAARAPTPADEPTSAPGPRPPAAAGAPAGASAAVPVAAAATPTPAAASSQPSKSPEEEFGLRTKREKGSAIAELTATAAAISTKPHGELVITLDNDQVWAEIAPGSKIKLKAGDAVRIEAGTLGSFILVAPNGRSSKVVRIR